MSATREQLFRLASDTVSQGTRDPELADDCTSERCFSVDSIMADSTRKGGYVVTEKQEWPEAYLAGLCDDSREEYARPMHPRLAYNLARLLAEGWLIREEKVVDSPETKGSGLFDCPAHRTTFGIYRTNRRRATAGGAP